MGKTNAKEKEYLVKMFECEEPLKGKERSKWRKLIEKWINDKAAEGYEVVLMTCVVNSVSGNTIHTVTMRMRFA